MRARTTPAARPCPARRPKLKGLSGSNQRSIKTNGTQQHTKQQHSQPPHRSPLSLLLPSLACRFSPSSLAPRHRRCSPFIHLNSGLFQHLFVAILIAQHTSLSLQLHASFKRLANRSHALWILLADRKNATSEREKKSKC